MLMENTVKATKVKSIEVVNAFLSQDEAHVIRSYATESKLGQKTRKIFGVRIDEEPIFLSLDIYQPALVEALCAIGVIGSSDMFATDREYLRLEEEMRQPGNFVELGNMEFGYILIIQGESGRREVTLYVGDTFREAMDRFLVGACAVFGTFPYEPLLNDVLAMLM